MQSTQLHHERHGHIRDGADNAVRATGHEDDVQPHLHEIHEFFTQITAVALTEIEGKNLATCAADILHHLGGWNKHILHHKGYIISTSPCLDHGGKGILIHTVRNIKRRLRGASLRPVNSSCCHTLIIQHNTLLSI